MRLLLLSNSTNAGETYLQYALPEIRHFLGDSPKSILFMPYAAVTIDFDEFAGIVNKKFNEINHQVFSAHHSNDVIKAVNNAEIIVVGGGNTFRLLQTMQKIRIINAIRQRIIDGASYIGWSAGANVACPTIRTTNDMPVVQPDDFNALNLIPFQINPHYIDAHPAGHAGETRETRIMEFIELNPYIWVAGLREGTMLKIENRNIHYIGKKTCRIFRKGEKPKELNHTDNFNFLLSCAT